MPQIPGMVINPGFYSGGRNPGTAPSLGQFTWATLPSAVLYPYSTALITDVGVQPFTVVSDGTRWVPEGPQVLARSAVAQSVTNITGETVLATVPIAAGLMGINGSLLVNSRWSCTNSANLKNFKVKLDAVNMQVAGTSSAGQINFGMQLVIANRGVANSQVGGDNFSGFGGTTANFVSAVDTTILKNLTLVGAMAALAETVTLEQYQVIVMP